MVLRHAGDQLRQYRGLGRRRSNLAVDTGMRPDVLRKFVAESLDGFVHMVPVQIQIPYTRGFYRQWYIFKNMSLMLK